MEGSSSNIVYVIQKSHFGLRFASSNITFLHPGKYILDLLPPNICLMLLTDQIKLSIFSQKIVHISCDPLAPTPNENDKILFPFQPNQRELGRTANMRLLSK